jgi:TatD DNase family protein
MTHWFVDTHAHLDGEEFGEDRAEVVARAKAAGVAAILIPGVDLSSIGSVMQVCRNFPGYCYPMVGLQPEEVKDDWQEVLQQMHEALTTNSALPDDDPLRYIAVGECGLDFYWSREFEQQQLDAFEQQVKWSIAFRLPLMIHCRKAQNEMLELMKPYASELPGGVFHCFTGNQKEAQAFLRLDRFYLGVGGVSTFKSSHLREDLPAAVPLSRLVIETDSPYMAPVPHRGKRNESAFAREVLQNLANAYGVTAEVMARVTNENVTRIFGLNVGTHRQGEI